MIGTTIKIALSLLLFGCLLKMPYGYFQFIRLAGCIGFAYLAYIEFEKRLIFTGIGCLAVAILLNPILKIYFTRRVWNIIDVIIGVLLILWIIVDIINYNNSKK